MCICVHVPVCMHMHTCICMCAYMSLCVYTCVCAEEGEGGWRAVGVDIQAEPTEDQAPGDGRGLIPGKEEPGSRAGEEKGTGWGVLMGHW